LIEDFLIPDSQIVGQIQHSADGLAHAAQGDIRSRAALLAWLTAEQFDEILS